MKSLLLFLVVFLITAFSPAQAQWQSLDGIGKDVATQGNTAWTIGSDDGIWLHSGGSWQPYPGGGRGQAIDVAPNGTPYVIGTDNGIHRGTGSGWVQIPGGGKGKDIAVDNSGRPWVIGMHDGVHSFDGANWHEYPGGGRGKAIAVGPGGTPFVIGMDNGIWKGTGGGWVQLPGGSRGKDIAVDGRGRPWVIGMDNQIYYHEGGTWHLLPGGGRGHRIAVTDSGVPLVIGMDNAIWRYGSAPVSQPVPPPASSNLTGRWNGNDGGRYFLRQVENELWWYGMSGDGGTSWTNVFQGRIKENMARGRWADVPSGPSMGHGEMHLQILSPNHLRATHRTGGFGGSEWTR
jgi:hypothetical protein